MATFTQDGIQFTTIGGQLQPAGTLSKKANGDFSDASTDGVEPFINAVEINWNSAELGTVNGINLGTINTTGELLQVIKLLAANINPASLLVLSSTSIEIIRPKGSLSSIAATGGSDNVTVNIGSTANITPPTSLTLNYGSNRNNSASTPTAIYNGSAVTPVWSVKSGTCVSISGTTITATSAGTAVLEAIYNNATATCTVTVTNESTTSTIYSGWQYTIPDSSLASISGTTITGIRGGTTNVKVTYGGKQCDLSGTVRIVETIQKTYYYYAGWTLPTTSNVDTIINETYPTSSSDNTQHLAGKKTTSKSSFSLASVNLYNSSAKINYYVLVPTGQAIYDTVFGTQMGTDSFTSQGTITVGTQIHTIYKSVDTTRNITSIEIK